MLYYFSIFGSSKPNCVIKILDLKKKKKKKQRRPRNSCSNYWHFRQVLFRNNNNNNNNRVLTTYMGWAKSSLLITKCHLYGEICHFALVCSVLFYRVLLLHFLFILQHRGKILWRHQLVNPFESFYFLFLLQIFICLPL